MANFSVAYTRQQYEQSSRYFGFDFLVIIADFSLEAAGIPESSPIETGVISGEIVFQILDKEARRPF